MQMIALKLADLVINLRLIIEDFPNLERLVLHVGILNYLVTFNIIFITQKLFLLSCVRDFNFDLEFKRQQKKIKNKRSHSYASFPPKLLHLRVSD